MQRTLRVVVVAATLSALALAAPPKTTSTPASPGPTATVSQSSVAPGLPLPPTSAALRHLRDPRPGSRALQDVQADVLRGEQLLATIQPAVASNAAFFSAALKLADNYGAEAWLYATSAPPDGASAAAAHKKAIEDYEKLSGAQPALYPLGLELEATGDARARVVYENAAKAGSDRRITMLAELALGELAFGAAGKDSAKLDAAFALYATALATAQDPAAVRSSPREIGAYALLRQAQIKDAKGERAAADSLYRDLHATYAATAAVAEAAR